MVSTAAKNVLDNLDVIDSKHIMSILLFILRNGAVTKTVLYEKVCRNPNMPQKLEGLEEAGLIMQMGAGNRSTLIDLTTKGEKVARAIESLDNILSEPPSQFV